MLKKFAYIIFLLAVCNEKNSFAQDSKINLGRCVTPDKKSGLCLRLLDCKHIYDLVLGDVQSEKKQFLTQSQCGIDNTQTDLPRKVLVCCPDEFCNEGVEKPDTHSQRGDVLPRAGVCGQVLWNRIFGGVKTQIDEFPWLALIKFIKPNNVISYECAGSLINSRYVMTAAHCVQNVYTPSVWKISEVRLGEHNLNTAPDCVVGLNNKKDCAPLHIDIPVEKVIVHEDYIPSTNEQFNDIALIRMKRSVEYTDFVKPICLPIAQELRVKNFVDDEMEIAGWGATMSSNISNVKLKATVQIWALSKCQQNYNQYGMAVMDTQLCAGGKENVDTCRGDSGGPLMVVEMVGDRQITFAAGIVSYGPKPCGLMNWPGIYTRVGSFTPWIQSKLEP